MKYNEVLNLIDKIEKSKFTTFKLKYENVELELGKNNVATKEQVVSKGYEYIDDEETDSLDLFDDVQENDDLTGLHEIVSPIVGVYYSKPAPDKEPFVEVGDVVQKGDVLCIIEAMKVLNEIKADRDGKIAKIIIENENIVEFGQPIMYIL
ncbi:MAG: acetyl-CoA carboxylase biotin carboxyl carrier protein [Lachnospirales bacterium]